jgi:hypothetical protein
MSEYDPIGNSEDVIDSRDVIARIEFLSDPDNFDSDEPPTDDEIKELEDLVKLAEQGSTFEDWQHGVTLVRGSYFVKYAQELWDDIREGDSPTEWPLYCIDWEWAAENLRMDYTTIELDGVDYWGR